MKRSKQINSSRPSRRSKFRVDSTQGLLRLQRRMAEAVMHPLSPRWTMQKRWKDGRATAGVVAEFIRPNDRLTSFERLELYNKQYWFRIIDSFYEDYPGLRAILGDAKFATMAKAYLARYPSVSWTMRDLGSRLEKFLRAEPRWAAPHAGLALDMARFEWAQVEAFDNEQLPVLHEDDILGRDPAGLRLHLQPYLRLLELAYPLDDFLVATKRKAALAMRGDASNAVDAEGRRAPKLRRAALPRPRPTYLAVHRVDNDLYYKKLEGEAYAVLVALSRGITLAKACERALKNRPAPAQGWAPKVREWFANWMELGWFAREKP